MKPFEVSRTDPSDETLFPLSAAQRATWFAQQFDPEVPILIAHYVELRGELDVELLDRETRAVANEFQSPLLKVIEIDGQPMQYVDEKAEISVGLVDLRGSPDPIEDASGGCAEIAGHSSTWQSTESSRPLCCAWATRTICGTAASIMLRSTVSVP